MYRLILLSVLAIIMMFSHISYAGFKHADFGADEYVKGELLVKYKEGASLEREKETTGKLLGAKSFKLSESLNLIRIGLPQGISVEEAVEIFNNDPAVEYAEPNYIYRLSVTTPNDPSFGTLWGLDNIGQSVNGTVGTADADMDLPEAWDMTTGSNAVIVAVIDSGVDYNHPDLASNIWVNSGEIAGNGIDDDGNGYVDDTRGWDFIGNDNDPMDANGHGTHVSGTIGAVGNNGIGITGVNWNVKIMPIRAGDASGMLPSSSIISSINYARLMGADVINASFGGYSYSQATKDAIDAFGAAGGIFVAAAGNESNDNDLLPAYPASYDSQHIISVAAIDQNDTLATFSNYGAIAVDVAAPGVNTYSTIPAVNFVWSDNFDDGNISDWFTGGTNNTWGLDASTYFSPSYSLSDSPGGNYLSNTNSYVFSQAIDLSGESGCVLEYYAALEADAVQPPSKAYPSIFSLDELLYTYGLDVLAVELSVDSTNWIPVIYLVGNTSGQFLLDEEDIGAFDGKPSVYLRFRLVTNAQDDYSGANIDDIAIRCSSTTYSGTEYEYFQGTSMASPHVAGLAALVKAQYPSLSNLKIKDRILQSADQKASLQSILATEARANAFNALTPVPTNLIATGISTSQIDLTWTDNTTGELGFIIERKLGLQGTYTELATLGPDVTAYSDTGLNTFTIAYYRVRSFSSNGNSAFSDEARGATLSLKSDVSGTGPCFIATATYGSYMADEVVTLRAFRDKYLMKSLTGKTLVSLYYAFSPPLANLIKKHESLRLLARYSLHPVIHAARHPISSMGFFLIIISSVVCWQMKRK